MRSKRMGVNPGVPDYIVIVGTKLVFIEMKRKDKKLSRISAEQLNWLEDLNKCGVVAIVCYGADEAIKVIESVEKNQN